MGRFPSPPFARNLLLSCIDGLMKLSIHIPQKSAIITEMHAAEDDLVEGIFILAATISGIGFLIHYSKVSLLWFAVPGGPLNGGPLGMSA